MIDSTEILTIQITKDNGSIYYLKSLDIDEYDDETLDPYDYEISENVYESTDLSEHSDKDLPKIFEFIAESTYDAADVRFVTIKLSVEITLKNTENKFQEILQKRALSKLTESEITALKVEKIATYIKLKYHKA